MVEEIGRVEALEQLKGTLRLWISTPFEDLQTGESVSVDGACLTVVSHSRGTFQCDVSPETLSLTIANGYEVGSLVNLERALKVGDRMGGHWVTGHVDTSLAVTQKEERSDCLWLRFDGFHKSERALVSRKGCITLNGVSLTVNEVGDSHFTVLLVPHTLAQTNLKDLKAGSPVNIEWDWMAKVVLEALQTRFSEKKENEQIHLH